MFYLGRLAGSGILKCDGEVVARAAYDLDGFFGKRAGVTSSGELRLSAAALHKVFGRKGVQLLTADGRLLDLDFSEKSISSGSDVAHVDVTGGLPETSEPWRS